ncbi:cutinase family protein [Frankia sp. R82]|uniref:cutinase family protein n=1 Tax=Frankia sp. R82 TaxID=2950553 RepID=UPI002044097C|nr:cutinase family protein [Frankia sp. R82]MCM3884465.1 cutinase family protein [Frankia sp. R82]
MTAKSIKALGVRALAAGLAALACIIGGGVMTAGTAQAATCSDVEVVFARASTELPGLGIVGTPFVDGVKKNLPGKSVGSYAVNYAADITQLSAGAGATDMTRHVTSVAAACPNTKFVLGGYSQGASVTDISIGIFTFLGQGETIPANLAPRVSAVVVFGNPLALYSGHIPTSSPAYGPKSKEFCEAGDPVCANGVNGLAHLMYAFDGSATEGARFAATRILGS